MKKFSQRWYEKNKNLTMFMQLFKNLDIEQQCEMAIDIIIKLSTIIDKEYEKFIKEISDYEPKDYKRWYDRNPNVHLAIETFRDLSEEQIDKLAHDFSSRIINKQKIETEKSAKEIIEELF